MLLALSLQMQVFPQKSGLGTIHRDDLERHMKFLASDELQGRSTGEPGLEIAARYLSVQAEYLGLRRAPGQQDHFQYYDILERSIDLENSHIAIRSGNAPLLEVKEPFYVFPPVAEDTFLVEGDVVFAGYGIHDPGNGYSDFTGLDIEGKIVLIMDRGPMDETGTSELFGDGKWFGRWSIRNKLPHIYSRRPKAVLLVMDPKSGYSSLDEQSPGLAAYLSSSKRLASESSISLTGEQPRTIMCHADVASALLEGTGTSLRGLQERIDSTLLPGSFPVEDKSLRIRMVMNEDTIRQPNVFGWIEGSDPALKDQFVVYVAHFDHVGTDGSGGVFNGADDNASGTVALIEMAEAFTREKKKPGRSIGFLWVSAEEIGLFGSRYFAGHPLVPQDQICAVVNLDMVGRTKTPEDALSPRPNLTIVGGDTVKVIGALQSSTLMEINRKALEESGMTGNYNYNVPDHPERYFYRSDHINFARKDIPVLFYSTGTHRDYHRISDEEDRIDYEKFLKMTQFCYVAGYRIAAYPGEIEVDNPMSGW